MGPDDARDLRPTPSNGSPAVPSLDANAGVLAMKGYFFIDIDGPYNSNAIARFDGLECFWGAETVDQARDYGLNEEMLRKMALTVLSVLENNRGTGSPNAIQIEDLGEDAVLERLKGNYLASATGGRLGEFKETPEGYTYQELKGDPRLMA